MRNLKKFLALVLAMLMTFSLMLTVNAASPVDFPDGEKITAAYQEAVDVLSALKVVKGDAGTGNFRPASDISRAEAAAILYRVVTGDVEDKNIHLYEGSGYFSDLAPDAWYEGYVNYCANNGLILGRGNNKFDPDAPVTGYEALVMILRAIGYNNPKEFSDSDWKLKASGYGRRLGITANIAEGSLGGSAKREVVAEIMFQGIQTNCVKYTMLNDYQPVVWKTFVDEDGKVTGYRYEDLLLRYFGIGGKEITPTRDSYGNPSVQWVKWADGSVAIEIPIKPVDTFYTAMDECDLVEKYNEGKDISVTNEFLNGRAVVKTAAGITRKLDKLHTTDDFVGAQGRETKLYHYTIKDRYGNSAAYWDIVYVDTYLGVIKTKTPKMTDTNNHEMQKASFGIEVGTYDATNGYATLHVSDDDYAKYNVGDVVTLNTWSPSWWNATPTATIEDTTDGGGSKVDIKIDWTGLVDQLTYQRLTTKASAQPKLKADILASGLENVGVKLYNSTDKDYTTNIETGWTYTFAYTGSAYPKGTYKATGTALGKATITFDAAPTDTTDDAIPVATHDFDTDKFSIIGVADTKTVTITGTTGAATDKTGIYTADGTIMANIVFHMDNHTSTTDAVSANNGVPTTVADFIQTSGTARGIFNEQINKSYKLWLDAKGNILGMKPAAADGVGMVVALDEGYKVGPGQYGVQAKLVMEDSSELTATFLAADRSFWTSSGTALGSTIGLAKNDLVKIRSYTKNGQTFYEQVDDYDQVPGSTTTTAGLRTVVTNSANANVLIPGDTKTLWQLSDYLVDDDTVFFIAYKDFQYDWGQGNTGDNSDITVQVFKGFKNIPQISSNGSNVVWQMLDNDSKYVAICAAVGDDYSAGSYDISAKDKNPVDDSYLIIRPLGTYAEYAEYEVMHNGVKETLKVANTNTGMNTVVETAMAGGQLIEVNGWNLKGYATSVTNATDCVSPITTLKHATNGNVRYKAGVLTDPTSGTARYLTLADNVQVLIVDRDNGNVTTGSVDSINQYVDHNDRDIITWELDEYGYIGILYIYD